MRSKIILNVLFEKKRIAFFFFVMCMFLIIYTSIQTMLVSADVGTSVSMPDFVFSGTVYNSQDGSYPFVGYNDIGDFTAYASQKAGQDAKCYGVVYRSLYNYYDQLTSIGFFGAVYGMTDECMEKFIAPYIEEGHLPGDGHKEAIVGYYFAKRYGLKIGDSIPQAITLSKEWDETDIDSYVVCGILDENISSYFNGSAVISRDTFEKARGVVEDNMMMGYYVNGENYDTIFLDINSEAKNYQVPEGKLNYKMKEYNRLLIGLSVAIIVIMSIVLITAVVSYLMKGITPKVGLLKATGVSTGYIIKTFLLGIFSVLVVAFGVSIGVSMFIINSMNSYVSEFYNFEVHTYRFSEISILLCLFEFTFILLYVFLVTYTRCRSISPKIAMARTV